MNNPFMVYMNCQDKEEIYPRYKKGDIIWAREPVKVTRYDDILSQYDYKYLSDGIEVFQQDIPDRFFKRKRADYAEYPDWITQCKGVPNGCIKEMARNFYRVTDVRVERLQDISESDAIKEGIFEVNDSDCSGEYYQYTIEQPIIENGMILNEKYGTAYEAYEALWNSTAKKGINDWDSNPYVFVYEYERIEV